MTAFLVVAVVVIVMPGPDFALTARNTLARGARAGVSTASGVVTGLFVWEVASVAGVAALIAASRPAFLVLRVLGAAYLMWLGFEALRAAWRHRDVRERGSPGRSPFAQGFLSNLGNPKIAVFFTSLLPQFGTSVPTLAIHALVFSALTFAWLVLVARAGAALRIPRFRRALDAVTGVVLLAFGIRLAAARR